MGVKPGRTAVDGPLFPRLFAKYKVHSVLLLLVSVSVWLGSALLEPPSAADLSEGSPLQAQALRSEWNDGDVIVFVRHLERCSRVDAPCLDGKSGITARSTEVGYGLGQRFAGLGLDKADIYSSPLTRTAQTADLLFRKPVDREDWLYKCEKSFLTDALQRKTPGRNLILVTHSSCMEELELAFKLSDVEYEYGASLFMTPGEPNLLTGERGTQQVLGFIDAPDWDLVFGS